LEHLSEVVGSWAGPQILEKGLKRTNALASSSVTNEKSFMRRVFDFTKNFVTISDFKTS
jgi:hypothetical protein